MVFKDGPRLHEIKKREHYPIANGEVISSDGGTVICTKVIGDRQCQATETTANGVTQSEENFQKGDLTLTEEEAQEFRQDWESKWKPSINALFQICVIKIFNIKMVP